MKLSALCLALSLYGAIASADNHRGPAPVMIAALGDSLTQGYGLVDGQGFVPQLERWLAARGHEVVMINAGVSGDTAIGGASRVAWTLTEEVDAMIVALGGNDLLRGVDPAITRDAIDTILSAAEDQGVQVLLVGLSAPGNYGADYQQGFNAIWPEMALKYNTLYAESFFLGLPRETGESLGDVQDLFQSDGLHPNPEGVGLIVEGLGPYVEALVERVSETPR